MTVAPEAREIEALANVLQPHVGMSWALAVAGDVRAAGYRLVPPGAVVVQTEGEAWEAMVERAYRLSSLYMSREDVEAMLRAAITPPKQETSGDE